MKINQRLQMIADQQCGYFSTRQALEAGYSSQQQNYHLHCGNWFKDGRSVYRLSGYPDTLESSFVCWSLRTAGRSRNRSVIVSHESALYYYGLSDNQPDEVHLSISVPFRGALPEAGCVLHHEHLLPSQSAQASGFRITTAAHTLRTMQPDLLLSQKWRSVVQKAFLHGLISPDEEAELLAAAIFDTDPAARQAAVLAEIDAGKETSAMRMPTGGTRLGRIHRAGWSMPARSFTLVELLIVIALIVMLAALLMPALQRAVESSRGVLCANNLHQVGIGLGGYLDTQHGWLPDSKPADKLYRQGFVDLASFACPSDFIFNVYPYFGANHDSSYFANARVFGFYNGSKWLFESSATRMNYLKKPSVTVLMAEAEWPDKSVPYYWQAYYMQLAYSSPDYWAFRHGLGAQTLFADQHTESVSTEQYVRHLQNKAGKNLTTDYQYNP